MLSPKLTSIPPALTPPLPILPPSPLSSTRGLVRSETLTNSSIQQAFRQLAEDPHFQPASFEATASVSWTVACVGALFDAVYENCITTAEDQSNVQRLSNDVKALEVILKAKRNISNDERDFEEKSLTLAKQALEELSTLLTALEIFNPIRSRLNTTTRALADSTAYPVYQGEELLFSSSISQGVEALLELDQQIKSLPKESATRARLELDVQQAIPPFLSAIEMWNKNALANMKSETQTLLAHLEKKAIRQDLTRQLLSLNTRQQEIYSEIETAVNSLKSHPELASIAKALQKESILIQQEYTELGKTIKSKKLPVNNLIPLKYGCDEWIKLMAKRPGKRLQFFEKVKWKFAHSKFWVARAKPRDQKPLKSPVNLKALTEEMRVQIPDKIQDKIDADRVLLGVLLMDNYQALHDSQQLTESLSQDNTNLHKGVKEALREFGPQEPSRKQLNEFLSGFHMKLMAESNPAAYPQLTIKEWLNIVTQPDKSISIPEPKQRLPWLERLMSTFNMTVVPSPKPIEIEEEPSNTIPPVIEQEIEEQELRNDYYDIQEQKTQAPSPTPIVAPTILPEEEPVPAFPILPTPFSDFQQPELENILTEASTLSPLPSFIETIKEEEQERLDDAIEILDDTIEETALDNSQITDELREEIITLQNELIRTSNHPPDKFASLDEVADWKQEVSDKCYAVKRLEEHIAILMKHAKKSLSANDEELDKYGKKHANNIRQARIATGLNLPGIHVPLPYGNSSDEVKRFLEEYAPDVFRVRETLRTLYDAYAKLENPTEPFLKKPVVVALLNTITDAITEAFKKAADDEKVFKQLVSNEFIEWLDSVRRNGDFLMVRSTGSEDTRQTANAGGNVSKAYVEPTQKGFTEAAKDVLCSYFGIASLQNQINVKINPFEGVPKLAITSQQLIGEAIGGSKDDNDVPISLVLFTAEPLYIGGENFRVMRISATYGHGEGVVGAQGIASDTALLLVSEANPDQLYVLYDNADKPERLAPVKLPAETKTDDKGNIVELPERIELRPVANSADSRKKPVLNSELLSRLYTWGVVGEKFFDDHPTDMEIVIKNGVIHPVQARPINRPDLLPTYLDTKKLAAAISNPVTESIRGEVMVPGKASVVVVTNPNQIRFAPTLEEAETEFVIDKEQIVIVTKPEPANSHPVVNFSGLGIPCLFMDDKSNIQQLIDKASPENPVVVCVQTGTARLWDGKKGNVDDFVSKGFTVHPAKIAMSFSTQFEKTTLRAASEVPQEVKDLILSINCAETHEAAMGVLEQLKSHSFVTEIKDRRRALERHAFVQKASKTENLFPKMAAQTLSVMTELDHKVDRAFKETESAFKRSSETERLRPLFHTKVLESLLIGKPEKGDSLGQYSKISLGPYYTDAKQLILYQKKFTHPVHFADIYFAGIAAFDGGTRTKWVNFLESLELQVESGDVKPDQVEQLKTMMQTLEKRGLLGTWFAFFFKGNSIEDVLATFPPEDAGKVEKFLTLGASIHAAKERVNAFSDPVKFEHAWESLQPIFDALTINTGADSIDAMLQNASPIGRLVILNTMQDAVDLYDTAIKRMKGSPAWKNKEEKVPLFKKMLSSYFTLLESWVNQLKPGSTAESENKLSLTIPMESYWSFEQYLRSVKSSFDNFSDDKRQLQASHDFSVAASIMGAQTDFSRHMPETLEDFFTLVHQNLMGVTSNLKDQVIDSTMIRNSALPDSFKKALEVMQPSSEPQTIQKMILNLPFISSSIPSKDSSIPSPLGRHQLQKTGFEISDTEIIVKYNIPLRNHSAQMVLKYDKATENTTIQGYLLGPARTRWQESAFVAQLLDATDIIHLHSPAYKTENELKLTWEVTDPENLTRILKEFGEMCSHSLRYDTPEVGVEAVKRADIDPNKAIIFAVNKLHSPSQEDRSQASNILMHFIMHFIGNGQAVDALFTQAEKVLTSGYSKHFTDFFLNRLIIRNKEISKLFDLVNRLIASPNATLREKGFDLLQDLVSNDHYLQESIPMIKNGICDPDISVQKSALSSIYRLKVKQVNVDDILSLTKGITDSDPTKRRAALALLEYQASHFYPSPSLLHEALEAAKIGSNDSDASVLKETFNLFQKLRMNKTGIDEALAFALSKADDPVSYSDAYSLITSLFSSNITFDENTFLTKASEMFFDPNPSTKERGLALLKMATHCRSTVSEFVINVAKTGVTDPDKKTVENSLTLLNSLVAKGEKIDEALEVAKTYVNNPDPSNAAMAYQIMTEVVLQGKYDDDIIAAVGVGFLHSDPSILNASARLYESLVYKEYALDDLAKFSIERVKQNLDKESNDVFMIFMLFERLIRQSPNKDATFEMAKLILPKFPDRAITHLKDLAVSGYPDEVITYAQELLANPDISNKRNALELFSALAESGIGINAAGDALSQVLENTSLELMNVIPSSLPRKVISEGYTFNEDTIKNVATNPDPHVRRLFIDQMYQMVTYSEYGKDVAGIVAKIMLNDPDDEMVRSKSLHIIQRLLERGIDRYDNDEAFAAAKNAIHSSIAESREYASRIMYLLRTQEKYQEETLAAAKIFICDSDSQSRSEAKNILRYHIDMNSRIDDVIAAASEAIKSNDDYVLQDALYLFWDLVDKGHGFEQAAAAVQHCKSSPQFINLQYITNKLDELLRIKTTFLGWFVNFLQHGFKR